MKVKNPEDFSPQYVFENMHPDDQNRFLAHEQKVLEFFSGLTPEQVLKYKVSYDYRMKTMEGDYKWILMQTVTIQTDENGAVVRVIGVQTDISHLKTNNQPSGLSFIGLDGEKSCYNVKVDNIINLHSSEESIQLTKREKEVLRYIVEGKTSAQIASALFISKHTVDSHRKKILQKTNCTTSIELIAKVVNEIFL